MGDDIVDMDTDFALEEYSEEEWDCPSVRDQVAALHDRYVKIGAKLSEGEYC